MKAPAAERVAAAAASVGVTLTEGQRHVLVRYLDRVLIWNARLGLTAHRRLDELITIDLTDALCVLKADVGPRARLIDVGSGAGFPGIPLHIVRPDLAITLLEANRKRVAFLERVAADLDLVLQIELGRAEAAGHQQGLREAFDVATSRAVAPLAVACELALPLVRVGGKGVFIKGPRVSEEHAAGARAAVALGGGPPQAISVAAADGRRRVVVIVPKIAPTPAAFPRRPSISRRKPVG